VVIQQTQSNCKNYRKTHRSVCCTTTTLTTRHIILWIRSHHTTALYIAVHTHFIIIHSYSILLFKVKILTENIYIFLVLWSDFETLNSCILVSQTSSWMWLNYWLKHVGEDIKKFKIKMHHKIKVHLLMVDIFYIRNWVAELQSSVCYLVLLQRMSQVEITVSNSFDYILYSGDTMWIYNSFPKAYFISVFRRPTARDTLQSSRVLYIWSCLVRCHHWASFSTYGGLRFMNSIKIIMSWVLV